MRKIVLDTNKLFAALLTRNFEFRETLFNRTYRFISPKFLIVEIFKHKERIIALSKAPEEDIYTYLHEVLTRIEFINEDFIPTKHYIKAHWLCKDTDENDTAFVAFALHFDAELWTDDEKLKTGLRKKGFDNFFEE